MQPQIVCVLVRVKVPRKGRKGRGETLQQKGWVTCAQEWGSTGTKEMLIAYRSQMSHTSQAPAGSWQPQSFICCSLHQEVLAISSVRKQGLACCSSVSPQERKSFSSELSLAHSSERYSYVIQQTDEEVTSLSLNMQSKYVTICKVNISHCHPHTPWT